MGVALDPWLERRPGRGVDDLPEILDLEPVLDIDRQDYLMAAVAGSLTYCQASLFFFQAHLTHVSETKGQKFTAEKLFFPDSSNKESGATAHDVIGERNSFNKSSLTLLLQRRVEDVPLC